MGESTGIAWTDSTINVWHGCEKVSAGCKHCYAEVSTPVRVKRAAGLEVWGKDAARSETKGWEASLRKWQRAEASFQRTGDPAHVYRVFGQSLSDTFEGRPDLDALRARFFAAIDAAPALTFQLLTKRPENVLRMVPPSWLDRWPAHVWIGCTTESQETADERIPHLLRVPAAVRFLSVEPQVGPIVVPMRWFGAGCDDPGCDCDLPVDGGPAISWVIQGGESGSKARPFDLAWARSLRDQCKGAGVAYFLKQLGACPYDSDAPGAIFDGEARALAQARGQGHISRPGWQKRLADSHGADESEWPADLRGCRAFPEVPS